MAITGAHVLPYARDADALRATTMVLPGGVEVLLYEPRHATAI